MGEKDNAWQWQKNDNLKKNRTPRLRSLKTRKEIQHRTVNIEIHKNNKYIYFSLQCLSPTLGPIMPQPLAAVTTRAMAMPPGTAPSATLLPNSPWVDARVAGPHTTNTATSSVETGSLGGKQRYWLLFPSLLVIFVGFVIKFDVPV